MPVRQNISVSHLRRALRIYWQHAWPPGTPACPALPQWHGLRLSQVLQTFVDESGPCPRHVLRLGNFTYPHMKFAVERGLSGGDFYFIADCHDAAPCRGAAPDPRWESMRLQNRAIKDAIETGWQQAGLPTLRGFAHDAARCARRVKLTGQRILLVDDEPANLEFTGAILRGDGFTVDTSCDGSGALARASIAPPDLVVSDYEMPGLSGRDVAHQLKARQETQDVPVLICSYADLNMKDLKPADAVLRRPFSAETLKAAVARLIATQTQP
ncbi:MAG: response regulator [Planctomycetes bacterium]|nr:response regulator [Planctomycetota bacterium]